MSMYMPMHVLNTLHCLTASLPACQPELLLWPPKPAGTGLAGLAGLGAGVRLLPLADGSLPVIRMFAAWGEKTLAFPHLTDLVTKTTTPQHHNSQLEPSPSNTTEGLHLSGHLNSVLACYQTLAECLGGGGRDMSWWRPRYGRAIRGCIGTWPSQSLKTGRCSMLMNLLLLYLAARYSVLMPSHACLQQINLFVGIIAIPPGHLKFPGLPPHEVPVR